jgi:SNF2 family DNA or RNA helicase
VLLLSTRHNLSGSHLIEANNLIFVHPFPEAPEAALKEWEQAVSRMQRYGQQRDLHVWYMVTKNTVEVELEQRFALYKASELARQKRDEAPPIDAGNY